jgi:hypothetical protein
MYVETIRLEGSRFTVKGQIKRESGKIADITMDEIYVHDLCVTAFIKRLFASKRLDETAFKKRVIINIESWEDQTILS